MAKLADLTEDAGIFVAYMVDDCAVEFFAGANASSHLEKHDRIRTVRYCLVA